MPCVVEVSPYAEVSKFGSEKNFLYSLTPRVLPGVIGGVAAVFKALAAMPPMAAAMPHVKAAAEAGDAALNALALQQWGDCSVLGGKSLTAIGLPPATLASFPAVPEFGAFAATAAGLNDTSVLGLSPAAAKVVVDALTADPTGIAVLGYLQWPVPALASKLSITGRVRASFDIARTRVPFSNPPRRDTSSLRLFFLAIPSINFVSERI